MLPTSGRGLALFLSLFSLTLMAVPSARAQDALTYRFAGVKEGVYDIKIVMDMPESIETHAGMIFLKVLQADPANGQLNMTYRGSLGKSVKSKSNQQRLGPPPIGFGPIPNPWQQQPEFMISPQGAVLREANIPDSGNLPNLLGPVHMLVLPPLPSAGQTTWKSERDLVILLRDREQNDPRFPPGFPRPPRPFGGNEDPNAGATRVPSKETYTYTLGPKDGSKQTINQSYELATIEKVGANARYRQVGSGQYVFDTAVGAVASGEFKLTLEINESNVTIKIPMTMSIRRFTDEEYAKYVAEQELANEKNRVLSVTQKRDNRKTGDLVATELPSMATKTDMAPQQHGGDFTFASPEGKPMIGLKVENSTWGPKTVFRTIQPLYEKPAGATPGPDLVFARAGYVVVGVQINSTDFANAARLIYGKVKDGVADTKETYMSEWLGKPGADGKMTKIMTTGGPVIGVFGKRGGNVHGFGLVLGPDESKKDAADAKPQPAAAFKPTWQPSTAAEKDLIPEMGSEGPVNNEGIYSLTKGQSLESIPRFKPPVTFRIVAMSDGQQIRIDFAGAQFQFNPEGKPEELRIYSQVPGLQSKQGAGRTPVNEWFALEYVVTPSDLTIFINGQERARFTGDFSKVENYLRIAGDRGVLKIKSVAVVK